MQYDKKHKHKGSVHIEMGPVRQNPIQRTVRTAHLSEIMCTTSVHNTTQNSSDNLSPLTSRQPS